MKMKFLISVAVLLTAVAAGSCINGGKLESISVSPSQAVIAEGTTQQFTATAKFSDGSAIQWTTAADWSSSNPDLASVGKSLGSFGLVTAISATTGSVTVTAKDAANKISGSATLFITRTPLVSIQVMPVNEIISAGTTTQFTAEGTCADGEKRTLTDLVTWNSSSTGVAMVSNDVDTAGLATALAPGTTTITATDPATHVSESTVLVVQ